MKFTSAMSYAELKTEMTRELERKAKSIVSKKYDEKGSIITLGMRIDMIKYLLKEHEKVAFSDWVRIRNSYEHATIDDYNKEIFIHDYCIVENALNRIILDEQASRNYIEPHSKGGFGVVNRVKEKMSEKEKWLAAPFMLLYFFLEDILSFNGPRMTLAIIRLFFISVILWLAWIVVWPFIYTLYPLYALIISFFHKVYTKVWLGISVLGTTYSIFNWKTEWLSFSLLEYFPSFSSWLIWLYAINVISGLVALFILVRPWIEKLDKKS